MESCAVQAHASNDGSFATCGCLRGPDKHRTASISMASMASMALLWHFYGLCRNFYGLYSSACEVLTRSSREVLTRVFNGIGWSSRVPRLLARSSRSSRVPRWALCMSCCACHAVTCMSRAVGAVHDMLCTSRVWLFHGSTATAEP